MNAALLAVLAGLAVAAAATPNSSGPAPSNAADFDLLRVQGNDSLSIPLRALGHLSNGCTGWLIGPCHVMTVAHCVYEPYRKIWWRGLDFHPGRNEGAQGAGDSPLGSTPKSDLRLHPNWTSSAAGPASDAAIIITSSPIGNKVGWFRHRPPSWVTEKLPQQQQQQQLGQQVSAQQLTLHIAGYPDNRFNGSMWQQCCNALDWQLQDNLLWHDCYARGGNSGSPVWVVWPRPAAQAASGQAQQQQRGPQQLSWEQVQAVGVHTSSLKVLKDSQLGVYAQELYAQGIASARQRQQAVTAGSASAQCTAGTSSFVASRAAAAAAGGGGGEGATVNSSSHLSSATGGKKRNAANNNRVEAAAAAGRPVGAGRRALLSGAGGREDDGEHTLLPVAVPLTGDTLAWVDAVLKEFARCPGE